MPIFEHVCTNTQCSHLSKKIEGLFRKYDSPLPSCTQCSREMKRVPSLVSKTPDAWGTDWREGLSSNEWSHSLGKKVSSKRQERLELESKGFVNERDLAPHFFEDREALRMEKMREQDRISSTYKEGIDKGLTKEEAIVQALPAKDCLSGALEKTWDNSAL